MGIDITWPASFPSCTSAVPPSAASSGIGTFTIGGASATVDGHHMRSNAVTVNVHPGGSGAANAGRPMVLDPSVVIDGRIADVAETRVIDQPLVVPRFVLQELQSIARAQARLKPVTGPSPLTTSFCFSGAQMGLRTSLILIVAALLVCLHRNR